MAFKVLSVSYFKLGKFETKWRVQEIEMNEKDLTNGGKNNEDQNDGSAGIQLFTAQLNLFENDETDFTFKFTVNFTGIVDNYRIQQMDGFLIRQLQISVKDQPKWANFQLITNDGYKSFPLHKWMLSVRSPVFAALFSSNEDIGSIHLAVDCTIYQMNQLIQFILLEK